ncbi:MAG: hypothetical protein IJV44_04905 [Prevotella sp.]|nr:hypothetical protein [Prevotella sp.]
MRKEARSYFTVLFLLLTNGLMAGTGKWNSSATGTAIDYTTSAATGSAAKDASGKLMTVVYLENLGFQKIGQNSNADDVAWLRQQGYQVIELDYAKNGKAVSPALNKDIIDINSSLQNGKFCGVNCSPSRSYILMEGYRLCRDISYYKDDPSVYNYPDAYKNSQGDSLFLDLVYPANPSHPVPVVVTFSYSNSYANNKHQRMYLPYFWGAFKDSFVEGASAVGFAWAVCDHPKYCEWGQGKYTGGGNKSLGAIEVNPDAACKVKSAIRTIRGVGNTMGLNGEVVVTGFSRGSTAAALAVGDGYIASYEDASRGRFAEESSKVQCAILGPGMFDYQHALASSNEYTRMSAFVTKTGASWEQQGALATIENNASAPTFFFHNTDDYFADQNKDPQGLYATQAQLMKERLDAVGTATATLTGYSSGHAVPQSETELLQMYNFMISHVTMTSGISVIRKQSENDADAPTYDLLGRRVSSTHKGLIIRNGRLYRQ